MMMGLWRVEGGGGRMTREDGVGAIRKKVDWAS